MTSHQLTSCVNRPHAVLSRMYIVRILAAERLIATGVLSVCVLVNEIKKQMKL